MKTLALLIALIVAAGLAWYIGFEGKPWTDARTNINPEGNANAIESDSSLADLVADNQPPKEELQEMPKEYNPLNEWEAYVILQKGTEPAGEGEYTDTKDSGVYTCRQCNSRLYRSEDKFDSHRVTSESARHARQRSGVRGDLSKRDLGVDRCVPSAGGIVSRNMSSATGHVAEYIADIFYGNRDVELDDGFKQAGV